MTNLDNIFKSRDITLSTKIRLVKAVVFLVVIYGCEFCPDTPGSPEGNTEGPGTASSEPPLPS